MVAFNSRSARYTSTRETTNSNRIAASQLRAEQDVLLVARFNGGDEAAFTEIVALHQARTFSVAFARLRNHADAEEITQDTFIRAHRALATFRGESSLATWLRGITVNLALNRYWYFFRRRRHLTHSLDSPLAEQGSATFADIIVSDAPSPVREAMTSEFAQLVTFCMARLSPSESEILRLRTHLDHSYQEIATALRLNIGTVKSRIGRARKNLNILVAGIAPDFAAGAASADWFGPSRSA